MFNVIFDMDGTLLDTQKICIPAWDYAGQLQGFENVGESIPHVCGMNEAGWSKYLLDHYRGIDPVTFTEEVRGYVKRHGVIKYKKGAEELLDFLSRHNIKYAIASGSSVKSIIHHLNELNALDKFEALAGGAEVKNGKPAPDVFLLAAERMGVPPESCFVFEDSPNGIKAAVAAGMKCIGIPDVAPFSEEIKKMLFAELSDLAKAIDIFKNYIK